MSYQSDTELTAINEILLNIGLNQVDTLVGTQRQDIEICELTLSSTLRNFASTYNYTNSYVDVELTPDVDEFILTNEDIYDVDIKNDPRVCIPKGGKLYDATNHTFEWGTSPVKASVLYYLSLSDLPEPARQYVIATASRTAYHRLFGPSEMLNSLIQNERLAYITFQRFDNTLNRSNLLHTVKNIWLNPRTN